MPRLHFVGLLTLCLHSTGCGLTTPSGLHVELELSSSTVSAGDSIRVEIVGRNDGAEPLNLDASQCPQRFEVLTREGAAVGPESVLCTLIALAPLRLEPGEEFRATYSWKGLALDGTRLPAGAYDLRGWMDPVAGDRTFTERIPVQVVK